MPGRLTPFCGFLLGLFVAACNSEQGVAPPSGEPALCVVPENTSNPAPLRRLTRFEYGRTVTELTGVPAAVALRLPPDEESLGFSNNAGAYSVSTLHATKYLELAEEIAELLKTGFTPSFDNVGGSMAAVVRNTAQLPEADRMAMAEYLKSLPAVEGPVRPAKAP